MTVNDQGIAYHDEGDYPGPIWVNDEDISLNLTI
jgi:hypothetical protein